MRLNPMSDLAEARIVIEEPCNECGEYGIYGKHFRVVDGDDFATRCPGEAKRRVVSGTPIRWCAAHESKVSGHPSACQWIVAINGFSDDCRFVDRILIDPKEET